MARYMWRDIVEIKGTIYAEEFPISGQMDAADCYVIDSFLDAVAEKHNVNISDIKTYMLDDIVFNPIDMPYGAESCGCYIDGIPEWELS